MAGAPDANAPCVKYASVAKLNGMRPQQNPKQRGFVR